MMENVESFDNQLDNEKAQEILDATLVHYLHQLDTKVQTR